MNDEILIALVRENSELYDMESSKYSDVHYKEKAWASIAKELNSTAAACKSRWNQLRDQSRKQKKKNITKSGQAAKPSKPWRYDKEMSFLEPFLGLRETVGNIRNDSDEDENIAPNENATTDADNRILTTETARDSEELRATNAVVPSANSTPCKAQRTSSRVVKNKTNETAASTLMKYLVRKHETEQTVTTSTPKDATDAFFEGIIAKVKRFSPYYKNLVESKIFTFVQELELQQIMQGQQSQHQQQQTTQKLPLQLQQQSTCHQPTNTQHVYIQQSSNNPGSSYSCTPSPHTSQSASSYFETFSYDQDNTN